MLWNIAVVPPFTKYLTRVIALQECRNLETGKDNKRLGFQYERTLWPQVCMALVYSWTIPELQMHSVAWIVCAESAWSHFHCWTCSNHFILSVCTNIVCVLERSLQCCEYSLWGGGCCRPNGDSYQSMSGRGKSQPVSTRRCRLCHCQGRCTPRCSAHHGSAGSTT